MYKAFGQFNSCLILVVTVSTISLVLLDSIHLILYVSHPPPSLLPLPQLSTPPLLRSPLLPYLSPLLPLPQSCIKERVPSRSADHEIHPLSYHHGNKEGCVAQVLQLEALGVPLLGEVKIETNTRAQQGHVSLPSPDHNYQ